MKILHKLFNSHTWIFDREIIHYIKGGGDYLPQNVDIYRCKCGMTKKDYKKVFTHLFGGNVGDIEETIIK